MDLTRELGMKMYRTMRKIRNFEDRVSELYLQGQIWGAVHLYTGQEAIAVGVCSALRPDDFITSTHRGHGHCIAKGGDLKQMMAEIFGRETGYCKGKGGSMHIADIDAGILGANAIVGDGIAIAVGSALGSRLLGLDRVSVAFFGDGAVGTGIFHEAINMSAVMKLPVIFVCENNQFAVSTPMSYSSPVPRVANRSAAYNIPAFTVDGNNILEVFQVAEEAVTRARKSEGPSLIEGLTYRWEGHYKGDPEVYRTPEQVAEWRTKKDPLQQLAIYLIENGLFTKEQIEEMDIEIQAEVEQAVAYAEQSSSPTLESLQKDLISE